MVGSVFGGLEGPEGPWYALWPQGSCQQTQGWWKWLLRGSCAKICARSKPKLSFMKYWWCCFIHQRTKVSSLLPRRVRLMSFISFVYHISHCWNIQNKSCVWQTSTGFQSNPTIKYKIFHFWWHKKTYRFGPFWFTLLTNKPRAGSTGSHAALHCLSFDYLSSLASQRVHKEF